MTSYAKGLIWWGMLQFVLGIISGMVVLLMENPRLGLSAHLGGTAQGMAMIIFGLIWAHVALNRLAAAAAFYGAIIGNYSVWAALQMAAWFGTSEVTPLAGAGYKGEPWQETLVTAVMTVGVTAATISIALIFIGLTRGLLGNAASRDA